MKKRRIVKCKLKLKLITVDPKKFICSFVSGKRRLD